MSEFPTDKTAASKKQSLEERMESKADEADSLMDMSQALLQLLGNAMPAGNTLLSPLLLAQAASGSLVPAAAAAAQMSLPWVLPAQYQQLMVLQQGLAQQLLVPGVGEFHDGQAAVTTDKTGNQLEPTAEANPLLTAILQRHTMTQRQLQKLDDSDRNPNSSLLTATGLPLQNVQFDGLTGQTGMWSTGTNDKAQAGIFQEQHQQPQQQQQQQQCQQLQQQKPRPPKKPLTPYMIFSKEIWHQVKAANSHLSSVTEIGAIVGRMWRDLDAEKKEQYNITFNKNKVMLTLNFYAAGTFQSITGEFFGVDQSTASRVISRVTKSFMRQIPKCVNLPSQEEADAAKAKFYVKAGFPNEPCF